MASPRAIWNGVLRVSLVSIPIKVYAATESSATLSFNQLHTTCQSRVGQRKWCIHCDREVPSAEIVKGFEFEKGKWVLILPEELDALQTPSTKVIELTQFTSPSSVPFAAIGSAYYLAPDGLEHGPAAEAYSLLCAAMAGQMGVGKLAMYGREYLVAVGPVKSALLLYTLHQAAELREPPYVASARLTAIKDLKLAEQIVATLAGPLNLADFTDQYQSDLRQLIDAKIAGEEIIEPAPVTTAPVVSLQEALTQSLAAVSATKKTPAKARPVTTRKRA